MYCFGSERKLILVYKPCSWRKWSEKKTDMDELESWSKDFKFVARQELTVSRAEVAEHFGLGVEASGVCLLRR